MGLLLGLALAILLILAVYFRLRTAQHAQGALPAQIMLDMEARHRAVLSDLHTGLAQTVQGVLVVFQASRTDGVLDHKYVQTLSIQIERALQDANVCFHADQHCLASLRGAKRVIKTFSCAARKCSFTEAHASAWQGRNNARMCAAQHFGCLLDMQYGKFEQTGSAGQQRRIQNDAIENLAWHRIAQTLLQVEH